MHCPCSDVRTALALAILMCPIAACSRTSHDAQIASPPIESTLAEQAKAVRAGRADEVRLERTQVTDADLVALDGLEDKLVRLNLSQSSISDEGLEQLAHFHRLTQLRLASDRITNEGLSHLQNLTQLRHLHLIGAPITDVGLAKLQSISTLDSLYIDGAELTDTGVSQFIKASPQVHFHIEGDHHRADPLRDDHRHNDQAEPKSPQPQKAR